MAAMAWMDSSSLVRIRGPAGTENLFCALDRLRCKDLTPRLCPNWGETVGIPEDAALFILECYGINAASPSVQARAVLLAFSRVGINACLQERLRIAQTIDPQAVTFQPPDALGTVERSIGLLEMLGGIDDRALMLLRDVVLNTTLKAAGGSAPQLGAAKKEVTLSGDITQARVFVPQGDTFGDQKSARQSRISTRSRTVDIPSRKISLSMGSVALLRYTKGTSCALLHNS